jgi:signal transduction histidine kinase
VSLAIASRGRPAVQRARLRSLSAAYGAIILVLVVDIVIGSFSGFRANANVGLQFVTELVVIAAAPLMYFSFSPPALLRQLWRGREEEPLRRSLEDMLLSTADRGELARKALDWAVRLVGAQGGLVADGGGVLASSGLSPEAADHLREIAAQMQAGGAMAAGGSGAAYAVPLSLSDGRGALVLASGPFTPLFGADEYGRMEAYAVSLAAALDRAALIQELRRNQATLEQRVAQRTAELQAANVELEAFSYTVSHDLRQPLRALDGFSRALGESLTAELDEQSRHYLDAISRNAQQMGRLIDALLGFSRLSRQPLQRSVVPPTAIARRVADSLVEQADGHAPAITIADLPACQADPLLLEEVFSNLLGNAVKFSSRKPDPAIEVGWREDEDGEVVYYVRDNGAGFDMKYADKLFGVFQRLHSQRDFEGTGAGLAIVQRIVHRHGGRVWAEGAVGEGATFFFTVPGGNA